MQSARIVTLSFILFELFPLELYPSQKQLSICDPSRKKVRVGWRRHFEKMRLKVNVASRKNSTSKRVSKRSLTYYKTGSKAFFMLRFSATRLSNILYDIKCSLLNVR